MNGYKVCATLRDEGVWTPILMLTAKDGEYDEAEALDTGADDFLSKPFSFVVLVARLRALGRRGDRPRARRRSTVGDLVLDPATRSCRARRRRRSTLTTREFALLEALMRRDGDVVSKHELLDEVWGHDFEGDPNIVEVYVGYLRRKVDAPFATHTILTVRGAGYRIVRPDAELTNDVTDARRRCGARSDPSGSASRSRPRSCSASRSASRRWCSCTRSRPASRTAPRNDGKLALETAVVADPRRRRSRRTCIVATRTPVFTWVIGPSGTGALPAARSCHPASTSRPRRRGRAKQMASPVGDIVLFTQRVDGPNGPLTVVVASPLDSAQRSADELGNGLWLLTAFLTVLVGALAWVHRRSRAAPGRGDPHRGRSRSRARRCDRRVPVPAGRDEVRRLARNDERDARPAGGRIGPPARVRVRRVARAAQPGRVDAHRPRGRAARSRRAPTGPRSRSALLAEDERLGALVDDLLALARLDEGQLDAARVPVDLDELVLADVSSRRRTDPLRHERRVRRPGPTAVPVSSRRWCATCSTTPRRHANHRVEVARRAPKRDEVVLERRGRRARDRRRRSRARLRPVHPPRRGPRARRRRLRPRSRGRETDRRRATAAPCASTERRRSRARAPTSSCGCPKRRPTPTRAVATRASRRRRWGARSGR